MLNILKKSLLLKITSANTVLVFVRMIFSVISQKVLAIIIGPEGIALVGNFKNVFNFFEQFSIFGTFNGLVKYISEFKNNKDKMNHLLSTAMVFAVVSSITSFLILFFGSNLLNEYIFGPEKNYGYIFKILAFVIPFMGINSILTSVLNGLSEYKIYTKAMITTIVLSTILIVFLTIEYNVKGSLLAICLIPIVNFLAFTIFYFKPFAKDFSFLKFSLHTVYRNKLLSYSLMTLVVILLINGGDIVVRNLIQETISTKEAGHWTAMTSISKIYMQFTLAIFPLYILPKYAEITKTLEFRKEIVNIYKSLVPLFLLGIILIYLLKNTIISILYTDDFLKMSNLFKWQLLGDLVKLCSLIISYQFLAKRKIGYFLLTESLSVFLFVGFSEYFIQFYGTEGIVLAHFVRYLVYFLVVAYILRHKLTGKDKIL